jgi:hypothetical protein
MALAELWDQIKALPGFPTLAVVGIVVAFLLYVFGYKLWNEWLGMPRWAEEWPAKGEQHLWRRFFAWFWLSDTDLESEADDNQAWPPARCPRCGGTAIHLTTSGALYCQKCRSVVSDDQTQRTERNPVT